MFLHFALAHSHSRSLFIVSFLFHSLKLEGIGFTRLCFLVNIILNNSSFLCFFHFVKILNSIWNDVSVGVYSFLHLILLRNKRVSDCVRVMHLWIWFCARHFWNFHFYLNKSMVFVFLSFFFFFRSLFYQLKVVLLVCCLVHEALEIYVEMRTSTHIHIKICNRKLNRWSNISFFKKSSCSVFDGFDFILNCSYYYFFISLFQFRHFRGW